MAKAVDNVPPPYDSIAFENQELKQLSAPSADEDAIVEASRGKTAHEFVKICIEVQGSPELPPTPSAPILAIITEPRALPYDLPSLVFEDVYEACIQYVNEHCCYSSKFVKQMALTDIFNGTAFHYTLETFLEKRESATLQTPYSGQTIDGPENGPPPSAWDVVVHPPVLFQDGKAKLEIPHTAVVSQCMECIGIGRIRCENCTGRGGDLCMSCCGTGRSGSGACIWCGGTGRQRCGTCDGRGQLKCRKCSGYGNIKTCKMLFVTWTTHEDDFISDTFNLPPNVCKKTTGKRILYEEMEQVSPISDAPDTSVRQKSIELIETHTEIFRGHRILKQKQILVAIPLTKVTYAWKRKDGEFYVFGEEKKVYFQDYPQKCCCCTCF